MKPLHNYGTISTPSTATVVVRHLQNLILEGELPPGARLASERDLATMLSVSRTVLREALKVLQERGFLTTRSGGGTFVSSILGATLYDPLLELLRSNPAATQDYHEYRRELEGAAAYFAAMRATPPDIEIIRIIIDRMIEADKTGGAEQEADIDAEFHIAIIDASHNKIFMHFARAMYQILRQDLYASRRALFDRPGVRKNLLAQHVEVANCVADGRADDARAAVYAHIDFVRQCLDDLNSYRAREQSAGRRLNNMANRRT